MWSRRPNISSTFWYTFPPKVNSTLSKIHVLQNLHLLVTVIHPWSLHLVQSLTSTSKAVVLWLRPSSPPNTFYSFIISSISPTNSSFYGLNCSKEQNRCSCAPPSITFERSSTEWLKSCTTSRSWSEFESCAIKRVLYVRSQITACTHSNIFSQDFFMASSRPWNRTSYIRNTGFIAYLCTSYNFFAAELSSKPLPSNPSTTTSPSFDIDPCRRRSLKQKNYAMLLICRFNALLRARQFPLDTLLRLMCLIFKNSTEPYRTD